jgi:hypothetical protein
MCPGDQGALAMPVISMFYGILVRMYFFDVQQHKLPHVHVQYGDQAAVFELENGEMIAGILPARQSKLVAAWIELHRDELMADWQLAIKGEALFKIEPLR